MVNATPRDTRAGFDIYRAAGGDISLEDLNAQLLEAGYGPVSQRTYSHYRGLVEAGYDRYISINRFDIARGAEPYENASAQGRYHYRAADLGVRVLLAKSSKLFEAYGRAAEVGDVGAVLRFAENEVIAGLVKLKPQPGDMVTIRYLESGRTIGGRVIESDLQTTPAVLEVEYARLVSIAAIGLGSPLNTADAGFRLIGRTDASETIDVVGRRLYHFFELVEGARSLANDAGGRQSIPVYASPPVLRRLSVASPVDVLMNLAPEVVKLVPWALIALVSKKAWEYPEKRKLWSEGTGIKRDNAIKDLELEAKRLDLEERKADAELRTEVRRRLRGIFQASEISDDEIDKAVDNYILEPARALGRSGITGLSLAAESAVVDEHEATDG